MDDDPIKAVEAKRLIRAILDDGAITLTRHFEVEAKKDGLSTPDAVNVLRGGHVLEAEWENGSWRYRVQTQKIRVVIAFESVNEIVLITIMRL